MGEDDRIALQTFVDGLFSQQRSITRFDAVTRAEALDLPGDLLEIIALLPPGSHARHGFCDQLNSALKGHGWTRRYGTVD